MPVDSIISERSDPVGRDEIANEQTLADAGFSWRERDGVRVLVCDALDAAGFVNGFSTRVGGVSPFPTDALNLAGFDEDDEKNIHENRRRFLAALGVGHRLALAWQVHGDTVKHVAGEADIANSEGRADALISDLPATLAGVKTADCVPVLLGDPATGAFAAVHAGWRGTVAMIVAKAIDKMVRTFGTSPADLICAIGPAAGGACYEVGQEVIDGFAAGVSGGAEYFTPTRSGHALVDLHRANRDQLLGAGVRPENIHTAPFCTMSRTDLFFSYRVEKKEYGRTGRLLSVVGRRVT